MLAKTLLAAVPAPPQPDQPPRGIYNPALHPLVGRGEGVSIINLFLSNFITIFFIVAAITALFVFLIGGIKWIISGGDKEKLASAQGTITAGAIGLVLVFSVYAIIRLIEFLFGLQLITIDITPLIFE